ncbi:tRNA uridine-5-carboxymethylaminomethyl(34) synthesis GTPase MnmE [Sphingomonas paeninsulae]|uniref:tRNA modification GTPase MnmE n=1 Tax=Sphingomonas paeninsulae TaxID=2319844 RepID=A0A494TKA3_SPHPE|nr:tRNA uridine-5-carboxymethylaminomethyl(34) synthesis GTPase MnmE [Sphingomonas paeninsulae]
MDTIFALSSGSPPAGIAVVRVSGPDANRALLLLTGRSMPKPRTATVALLMDPDTRLPLDHALTLAFPRPKSATGEDVVELHLHGGRAVVAAVLNSLSQIKGLRPAEPGEFTRRAFENNRIDLAQAEGLGDLLSAETEAQRRSAIAQVGGSLHRLTEAWIRQLLQISARVEAVIDFSDEDDVDVLSVTMVRADVSAIVDDIKLRLANPPAERLHSGLRVAIIGPPNSGKSTLFNCLVNRDAAIVSEIPGTTRDVIEGAVKMRGLSLVFVDTAGIREETDDPIERLGVERSRVESQTADIVLALGGWGNHDSDTLTIDISAKSDLQRNSNGLQISATTGEGIPELIDAITAAARSILPAEDGVALNARHRSVLIASIAELQMINAQSNELLIAEHLRMARKEIGKVVGGSDAEAMLDILFGAFCIGK